MGNGKQKIKNWLLLIICMGLYGYLSLPTASAQSIITQTSTFQEINPWLSGANAAGLAYNPDLQFSIAQTAYHFTKGDFKTPTEAPNLHGFTINSQSYRKLGRIFLYGNIGYYMENHRQRRWNAMLQPKEHLISFGDSLSGTQQNETYNFCGKIAVPLNSNWKIGGLLEYNARSNKRRTDPRNNNKQTDILFSPSLIYTHGRFKIGANFIFHRIVEEVTYTSLDPEIREAQAYFPLWFYTNENISSGLNSTRTYRDQRCGGALQCHLKTNHWEWFNEFQYSGSTENIDILIARNIRAGETERREFNYSGMLRFGSQLRHTFSPRYHFLSKTGYEILQGTSESAAASKYEDYGRTRRSNITTHDAQLSYVLSKPDDSFVNRWAIQSEIGYRQENTKFFIYPASFEQPITNLSFASGYERRISIQKSLLEIAIRIGYTTGHGTLPKAVNSENGNPEIKISQNRNLLLEDFQVQTAKRLSGKLFLQYTRPVSKACSLFCATILDHTQALADCSEMHRTGFQFSAGILF